MKKPSLAGLHECWELSAREVLLPLLRPGEPLRIALSGATGWLQGVSFLDLLPLLLGVLGPRTTYIGITDEDLVFAFASDPHRPSRLQRASLGSVSIVKFRESRTPFLIDVLIIDTGTRRLTLSTGRGLRPVIRELAATLARRRQEADMTGSAGHLQGTLVQGAPGLPLLARLASRLRSAVIDGDIAATLRAKGPARASLRASRYSLTFFAASFLAAIFLTVSLMAVALIVPTGLSKQLRDILLFILVLPLFVTALLGAAAALAAGGLAIYSIFRRGERPLTVIAALLAAAALSVVYYIFAALLLTPE